MTSLATVLAQSISLKGCAFKVYAAISDAFERNACREVALSTPQLQRITGYSHGAVASAIKTLDERGAIYRISARGGGTNGYQVPALESTGTPSSFKNTPSRNDEYPVQKAPTNPQDPVQKKSDIVQKTATFPLFPQISAGVYKDVSSSLVLGEERTGEQEQWKTPPPPPPELTEENPSEKEKLSEEVAEFAEACFGPNSVVGVLRRAYAVLPSELGIAPARVAEFVLRKWRQVAIERYRGKPPRAFTPSALYSFVRKDLAEIYGVPVPVRRPVQRESLPHLHNKHSHSYAASAAGGPQ